MLLEISHAIQKTDLNNKPRIKTSWALQEMLVGVGWFSRELPLTPTNLLQQDIPTQLTLTINKERKNSTRSPNAIEIPAITLETLTPFKP